MERKSSFEAPWKAISAALQRELGSCWYSHHPPLRVLHDYLASALPTSPPAWTLGRAEQLARGRLGRWTMLEVAAHVSSCLRCRIRLQVAKGLYRLSSKAGFRRWQWLPQRLRWAYAGWALAGIEIIAIAVLLASGILSQPQPDSGVIPEFPKLTNTIELNALRLGLAAKRIRIESSHIWEDISAVLMDLHLTISGPDRDGNFVVIGDQEAVAELIRRGYAEETSQPDSN